MGLLVDGEWRVDWKRTDGTSGKFERSAAQFRNWITADGRPGPSGRGGFKAEAGRYLLYVSLACPWAHRTLIFRRIKGLESMIGASVVNWHMGEQGWSFADGPGVIPDPVANAQYMHEVYTRADPEYSGVVSVPACCGTRPKTRSSATNHPRSSGCSIPHSIMPVRSLATTIRSIYALRSTRSTSASTRR